MNLRSGLSRAILYSLALLFLAAVLVTAAILPTEPFPVPGDRIVRAPFGRRNVRLAASRDQFLAVWEDDRSREGWSQLWANRVTLDGQPLHGTGFPVTIAGEDDRAFLCDVESDGTDFLIAWRRERALSLVKLSSDGRLQSEAALGYEADDAQIVWLGDVYAVIFRKIEYDSSRSVRFVLIDGDGRQLSPARDLLQSQSGIGGLRIVLNRSKMIAVWMDYADYQLHTAAFAINDLRRGQIEVPAAVPATGKYRWESPSIVSIATDGDSSVVLWSVRIVETSDHRAYRTLRLDHNGLPAGTVTTLDRDTFNAPPQLLWSGGRYAAVFAASPSTLRVVNLDENAIPDGSAHDLKVNPEASGWTAAESAGALLVVWIENQYWHPQIYANVLRDGSVAYGSTFGGISISGAVPSRTRPNAVWRGNHYLAAWSEVPEGSNVVFGRFDPAGRPLDGGGLDLGRGVPKIASDGSSAMIATFQGAWYIDEAGHVSQRPIPSLGGWPSNNAPLAHWNGNQYLVLNHSYLDNKPSLIATRYDRRGKALDSQPVRIAETRGLTAVGWTGHNYVVVWREEHVCFPVCVPPVEIWALSFSSDLTPIGAPLKIADVNADFPAIGEGKHGLLIVWSGAPYWAPSKLRGLRISPDDIALDPKNGFAISDHAFRWPSVTSADDGWLVTASQFTSHVSYDAAVSPAVLSLPFVAPSAASVLVSGGPHPLVLYEQPPRLFDSMPAILGKYLLPQRTRAVGR